MTRYNKSAPDTDRAAAELLNRASEHVRQQQLAAKYPDLFQALMRLDRAIQQCGPEDRGKLLDRLDQAISDAAGYAEAHREGGHVV